MEVLFYALLCVVNTDRVSDTRAWAKKVYSYKSAAEALEVRWEPPKDEWRLQNNISTAFNEGFRFLMPNDTAARRRELLSSNVLSALTHQGVAVGWMWASIIEATSEQVSDVMPWHRESPMAAVLDGGITFRGCGVASGSWIVVWCYY